MTEMYGSLMSSTVKLYLTNGFLLISLYSFLHYYNVALLAVYY